MAMTGCANPTTAATPKTHRVMRDRQRTTRIVDDSSATAFVPVTSQTSAMYVAFIRKRRVAQREPGAGANLLVAIHAVATGRKDIENRCMKLHHRSREVASFTYRSK